MVSYSPSRNNDVTFLVNCKMIFNLYSFSVNIKSCDAIFSCDTNIYIYCFDRIIENYTDACL